MPFIHYHLPSQWSDAPPDDGKTSEAHQAPLGLPNGLERESLRWVHPCLGFSRSILGFQLNKRAPLLQRPASRSHH